MPVVTGWPSVIAMHCWPGVPPLPSGPGPGSLEQAARSAATDSAPSMAALIALGGNEDSWRVPGIIIYAAYLLGQPEVEVDRRGRGVTSLHAAGESERAETGAERGGGRVGLRDVVAVGL